MSGNFRLAILFCFLFPCVSSAQNYKARAISLTVCAGSGDALRKVDGRQTPDGREVNIDHYWLKAYNAVLKYHITDKIALGIEIGQVSDYSAGYYLQSNQTGSGFGIHSFYGLPNRYVVWHVALSVYQQLLRYRRFSLVGYGGIGLQKFISDNYPKAEELNFYSPGDENKYYVLPSQVNKRPLLNLNTGLCLNYHISKRSTLIFQPSLRLGSNSFLIDNIRIETPGYKHEVQTRMNGSNALVSLGYSIKF